MSKPTIAPEFLGKFRNFMKSMSAFGKPAYNTGFKFIISFLRASMGGDTTNDPSFRGINFKFTSVFLIESFTTSDHDFGGLVLPAC